jgi:hypothetical protein
MSNYGLTGYDVTIAVVVRKTIFVPCNDEDAAIDEAINGFKIDDKDWKMEDLEVEDVQPDYFDN